jgi:hypothetical protein
VPLRKSRSASLKIAVQGKRNEDEGRARINEREEEKEALSSRRPPASL